MVAQSPWQPKIGLGRENFYFKHWLEKKCTDISSWDQEANILVLTWLSLNKMATILKTALPDHVIMLIIHLFIYSFILDSNSNDTEGPITISVHWFR